MFLLEELKIYPVGARRFVYAPTGRGEELLVHLASHGIGSAVSEADPFFDRLELKGHVDLVAVQAVLDTWER